MRFGKVFVTSVVVGALVLTATAGGRPQVARADTAGGYTVRWSAVPAAPGTARTGTVALVAPCPYGTVQDGSVAGAVGCSAHVDYSQCLRGADGSDAGQGTVAVSSVTASRGSLRASFTVDCGPGNLLAEIDTAGGFSPSDQGGEAPWGKTWPDLGRDFLDAGDARLALTHLTWHAGQYAVDVHGLATASDFSPCSLDACQWVLQGGVVVTPGAGPTVVAALANGSADAGTPGFAVTASGTIPTVAGGPITYVRAMLSGSGPTVESPWVKVSDSIDGYDLDAIAQSYATIGGAAALCVTVAQLPSVNLLPSSISDPGKACLALEADGVPIQTILGTLAAAFGAAILIPLAGNLGTAVFVPPFPDPPLPAQPPAVPTAAGTTSVVDDWGGRMADGLIGPARARDRDPTPYTQHVLQVAATQCLQLVGAAALRGAAFATANPCEDLPILFPAGTSNPHVPAFYNAYAAAVHDRDTIAARPWLVQLNYMSGPNKKTQVPPGWYTKKQYRSADCLAHAEDPVFQCDEYPLYASRQGGPADLGGAGASLRAVPSLQNRAEGTVYSAMITQCGLQSAAPVSSQGLPTTGGTPFLVIPLTAAPIPSFYLCPNSNPDPSGGGGGGGGPN